MADVVHPGESPNRAAHDIPPENSSAMNPAMHPASNSGGVSLREDYSLGSPRTKVHRRSPSVLKDSDQFGFPAEPYRRPGADKGRRDSADVIPKRSPSDARESSAPYHARSRSQTTASSTMSNLTSLSTATNGSGSSSGSASTVRNPSPHRRDEGVRVRVRPKRPPVNKPNPLNFLDRDSPEMSPERIRQSIEMASSRSVSSASSGLWDDASNPLGGHETDRSTSPERSINGDGTEPPRFRATGRTDTKNTANGYGSPEISYASGNQGHMSPDAATPRAPNQGPFMYPPRPEMPSLSGYNPVSTAPPEPAQPALRPICRRFQGINHRLLLQLQHELSDLEEQLDKLDGAETPNPWSQDRMHPPPRPAEPYWDNGRYHHRLELMSQAGFKLDRYCRSHNVLPLSKTSVLSLT